MNKDERNREKQRKEEKKKKQKKHKNQTRGKATKTFGQASWLSTFHPQWFFFTEGGFKKSLKFSVCCSWVFGCGHEIPVFTVFFEGNDNGILGSAVTNLQGQLVVHPLASWLSTFFGQIWRILVDNQLARGWTTSWPAKVFRNGREMC